MTLPVLESFSVATVDVAQLLQVTKPSGVVIGNTLLAILATDGSGESLQAPGAEWVRGSANVSNTMTLRYFWKTATQADVDATDYTFTWGSDEGAVLGMARLSGCDTSGVVVDIMGVATGSSTTPTCPSVTTTVDDCLILRMFGADDDDITTDTGYPGGTTGVYVRESLTSSSGLAHEPQVSAGATGTAAFTMDATEAWAAFTIAIREPQTAPTGTDVQVQHFHYTLPTGTGNDSFTGLDFTPKAIIFFGNAATGGGANADALFWQGMIDGTNEFALSCYGEDSAQNTQRHINETNGIMALLVPGATESFLASFVSFNANGFTFNFSNGAPAGTVAHGIAIGGADAEVFCGSVDSDVEGFLANVGFQPDMIFTMNSGLALGGADSAHAIQSVGVAARNPDQGSDDVDASHGQVAILTYQGNDATDQNAKHSVLETDIMTGQQFTNARTWGIRLDHVTGNQFSWGDTGNADGFYFLALRLGGLKVAVGNFTKATGAAPVSQSLPDLGFIPQSYGLMSGEKVNTDNATALDASFNIGNLSDRGSLVQGSVSSHDVNNATDAQQRQEAGILLQFLGAADALDAEAIGDAITDATPSFTWDPNDSNAHIIGYWAVEEEPAAAPTGTQSPVFVGSVF